MFLTRTLIITCLVFSLVVVVAGCHKKHHDDSTDEQSSSGVQVPPPQQPPPGGGGGNDVTAPSAVIDLSLVSTTDTTATLTWTAPGDDLGIGTASTYDMRYSTSAIVSDADFLAATPATGEPVPLPAGSPEMMVVTGLLPSTHYWFALKAADEVPNWSAMSNVVDGFTLPAPDVTPPASVIDLFIVDMNSVAAKMRWTAPGDDGSVGTATSYDLRYSTSPIVTDADYLAATPAVGEPVPGPAGTVEHMIVHGLLPATTYWFAIKSSDEAGNVSGLSNVPFGTTDPLDVTAPAAIIDLSTSSPTFSSITLHWTAPGDDGSVGTAAVYKVRYALAPILTLADWNAATPAGPTPVPSPAGTPEVMVVGGLSPSTTYWFNVRSADEVGNKSGLSNSPPGTTLPPPDVTPPSAVIDLSVIAWTDHSILLSWAAPGDDGLSGTASMYDIRYSLSPILTEADFAAATLTFGEPAPLPAGTVQTFNVTGLSSGTTYWFAMKSADEVPNWSGLSNSPSGTTSTIPVVLTIEEEEPNNTCEEGTALPMGTAGHGHLDTFADLDYWGFDASEGDLIMVELFATRMTQVTWDSSDAIPQMSIVNEAGDTLIRHSRSTWQNGDHDLDIPLFRIPETGHYCIRLQASGGAASREYAVLVTGMPGPVTMEMEPVGEKGDNDTSGSAEDIDLPVTVYGWHVKHESDFYSFHACDGDVISVDLKAYRNGIMTGTQYFNPRVWLYAPGPGSGHHPVMKVSRDVFRDPEFTFLACSTGDWLIRVFADGGSVGEGAYFLSVDARPCPDEVEDEPNDSPAEAQATSYESCINGNISDKDDDDWYSFEGVAGDMVQLKVYDRINSECSKLHSKVRIYRSDGTTLLPFADKNGALNIVRFILPCDDTFFIRISGIHVDDGDDEDDDDDDKDDEDDEDDKHEHDEDHFIEHVHPDNSYMLHLHLYKAAAFESEPNDSLLAPGSLDLNARAAGQIGIGGDVDVYGFMATDTQLVTLSIYAAPAQVPPGSDGDGERSGWGSTLKPKLTVRDSMGTVIATSFYDTSNVSAESVTAPLPTLAVSFVAPASGSYTVTVESMDGPGGPSAIYVIEER